MLIHTEELEWKYTVVRKVSPVYYYLPERIALFIETNRIILTNLKTIRVCIL